MNIIYFGICKWDIHLKVIKKSKPVRVATSNGCSRPRSAAADFDEVEWAIFTVYMGSYFDSVLVNPSSELYHF